MKIFKSKLALLVIVIHVMIYYSLLQHVKTTDQAIPTRVAPPQRESPNDDIDIKPYILNAFSTEILSYFASCDESIPFDNKNALSDLGAQYFTANNLHKLRWFTAHKVENIQDANIVIIPFQFTLALTGRCKNSSSRALHAQNDVDTEDFQYHFTSILRTLYSLRHELNAKAILFILHRWQWSYEWASLPYHHLLHDFIFNMSSANIFVGHYERKDFSPWSGTHTVVLPYTIPFALPLYQRYNNMDSASLCTDFQHRPYSLFFMGTACKLKGMLPGYYYRISALEYMLDTKISTLNPFGIITNGEMCHKAGLARSISYCLRTNSTRSMQFPCLLKSKASRHVNKDNKLYIEGMRQSKFNLMIAGDTPTSAKFYDSIAFNMINIFVGITVQNMRDYLPFVDHVPYEQFAFFIGIEELSVDALHNIITNITQHQIQEMLGNLSQYKRDILWNIDNSRVVNNVMVEVKQKLYTDL